MKVLIISHNAISTTNNMGKTLYSLFSEFDKEELCQLYIHPMIPDVDICSSYYCISDEEIFRSIYTRALPGHLLDKSENIHQEFYDIARKNHSAPVKRILRDFMWKISKWDNEKLEKWLEEEKPTCIFLAPGYAKFIYDIALKISERKNIPIITYICDDYYFVKEPDNITGKLYLKMLQKKTDKLFERTAHLIAINEEIRSLYQKRFRLDSTVIMTGASFHNCKVIRAKRKTSSLSYFGNIRCNRNVSLAKIGEILDRMNQDNGTDYHLKIYTDEKDPQILKVFNGINSICMCGFVSGDEFQKEFLSADILLHVEAFDKESIDLVKKSISTKIADSLGAGIPLFAYGPEEVASIRYLKSNQCAIVAANEKELENCLYNIWENDSLLEAVSVHALKKADENHDITKNSILLKKICKEKSRRILTLSEIKAHEMEILLFFRKICNENNIRYYLANGTLLGAVKYYGFIPWDDDIDVFVPRDDYDRLIKIFQNTERYKLFAIERDRRFRYPFAKLCDMTTGKEEKNINNEVSLGIDIDIFPLDYWPDNLEQATKQNKNILKIIKVLNYAKLEFNPGKTIFRTMAKAIVILFARIIGAEKLISKIQKEVKFNQVCSEAKYCGCVVWPIYGDKEIISSDVFESAVEVEFEGEKFPAPVGYDIYLRSLYGDYEKDPPLEKQKTHHNFIAYQSEQH